MRSLRDLLTTWNGWSARDTLIRALASAGTDRAREALSRSIADMPEVDPLDALSDATELVALLQGWQWQAVYAARRSGTTWDEIARATGTVGEQAQADYIAAVERQERYGISDASAYREVV